LIHRNRDSHRFFIIPNLIEPCAGISWKTRSDTFERGAIMLDVILLALGLAFFALSIGYAYACDRL